MQFLNKNLRIKGNILPLSKAKIRLSQDLGCTYKKSLFILNNFGEVLMTKKFGKKTINYYNVSYEWLSLNYDNFLEIKED